MVALLLTVAAVGGLVIAANATGADSAGFVITVTLMGFGLALFVGESLERRIPGYQWDRISFSRDASRRWGVHLFNAVLSWIGWNRLIFAMRGGSSIQDRERLGPTAYESSGSWSCVGVPTSYRHCGLGECGWRVGASYSSPSDRDRWPPLSGPAAALCTDQIESRAGESSTDVHRMRDAGGTGLVQKSTMACVESFEIVLKDTAIPACSHSQSALYITPLYVPLTPPAHAVQSTEPVSRDLGSSASKTNWRRANTSL
ncbi:hypothetical protein [Corynebacterium ulcerans]|uniref:hypothetical protein n=1 Tax=Corynebacterium ulcerans TaxID=65058 RepID=UPI0034A3E51B